MPVAGLVSTMKLLKSLRFPMRDGEQQPTVDGKEQTTNVVAWMPVAGLLILAGVSNCDSGEPGQVLVVVKPNAGLNGEQQPTIDGKEQTTNVVA